MTSLYKFKFNCGRNGDLYGLFIEDSEKVRELIKSRKTVYFGEVLGKHSEICGPIDEDEIEFVSNDPLVIKMAVDNNLCFGFNPFHYLNDDSEDDSIEE